MTHLTFSSSIEAADSGRRIISGVVVPFGKIGHTSVGPVIFERGSIQIPNTSKIKLLAQHQQTASGVIGRAQSFSTTDEAIYGSFKVSASRDGENYLIKASEGLLDGLSVGVDVIASKPGKDGTLYVQEAVLKEVSLVETPAFSEAIVTNVAAAEGDMDELAEEAIETAEDALIQQISDAVDGLKKIQVVEKALEETETQTESEATVSEDTSAATTEASAAVDSSRPTIKASVPYGEGQTRTRHGIDSMGRYVEHKIKAALGDSTSREWVAASEDRSLLTASDTFGNNPAFNPIQYLSKFVSNTNFGRPTIDAVTRQAAPATGLQVNIPALVTSAGGGSNVAPTVAANTIGDAPSDTAMTSSYETLTLQRFAGQQTIDLSLIERSDPIFMDQLAIQLERAYRLATDAAMVAVLTAQGTQATGVAGTTAGLISYIGTEAPAAYKGSSYFAENIVANTDWWSNTISALDSTGRPLFNTTTPWNSAGEAKPTTIRGTIMGLDLFVDKNLTSGLVDESAFIIAPETALWIESPEAFFSVNVVSSLAVQTALYGYGQGKVLIPAGVRRFNLA
jgi:HK97 family phage prohead protease